MEKEIKFICGCGSDRSVGYDRVTDPCPHCGRQYLGVYDLEYLRNHGEERYRAKKVSKNFVKCLYHPTLDDEGINTLEIVSSVDGLFGSAICRKQFEKIESVLSKRYIKLPFGIRIIL